MAETYGRWIRRRVYMECTGCKRYVDFGPGVLSADGTIEVRTCEECGAQVETEAFVTAPPGESTHWNLQ